MNFLACRHLNRAVVPVTIMSENSVKGTSTEYQLHTKESNDFGLCLDDDDDDDVSYFMTEDVRKRIREDTSMTEHEKDVVQRLARRSFHLPGNSFWQDWHSFVGNNHPLFGLRCAHEYHPFGLQQRLINLVASIAFGLAATSTVVLWYYYEDKDMSEVALTLLGHSLTKGNMSLLLFGSGLHVLFDLSLWYIQACPFCRPNGLLAGRLTESHKNCWLWFGSYVAVEITIMSITLAVYVILLRASVVEDGDLDDDKGIQLSHTGIKDYLFVSAVFLEFAFSQLVMFPIVAFTLFSGILGCGRVPIIGGRPYEILKLQRQNRNKAKLDGDSIIYAASSSSPESKVNFEPNHRVVL